MSEPSGTEQSFNEANIAEFRANGGKVGGQFEGFPLRGGDRPRDPGVRNTARVN
ncbi:Hemerythrin [Mycobacteroides abscessus subsp. abscessus]|nr:Hemerythrin [Mycobacteroides abscessus subsp. abscessus]